MALGLSSILFCSVLFQFYCALLSAGVVVPESTASAPKLINSEASNTASGVHSLGPYKGTIGVR